MLHLFESASHDISRLNLAYSSSSLEMLRVVCEGGQVSRPLTFFFWRGIFWLCLQNFKDSKSCMVTKYQKILHQNINQYRMVKASAEGTEKRHFQYIYPGIQSQKNMSRLALDFPSISQ